MSIQSTQSTQSNTPMGVTKLLLEQVDREYNMLTPAEMEVIRDTYDFPASVLTLLPESGQSIRDAPEGFVGIYYYNFYFGMRLPIPRPIIKFCQSCDIPLAQLTPTAFKALLSLYHLMEEQEQKDGLSPAQVYHTYRLFANNSGWVTFAKWQTNGKPLPLPDSVQGWRNQFFFIGGTGWRALSRRGPELVLPTEWIEAFERVTVRPLLSKDHQFVLDEVLKFESPLLSLAAILRRRFPEWGRWTEGEWYNLVVARVKAANPKDPAAQALLNLNQMRKKSGQKTTDPMANVVTVAVAGTKRRRESPPANEREVLENEGEEVEVCSNQQGGGVEVLETPRRDSGYRSADHNGQVSPVMPAAPEVRKVKYDEAPGHAAHRCYLTDHVPNDLDAIAKSLEDAGEGVLHHVLLGSRLAEDHLRDDFEHSGLNFYNIGQQKVGEGLKFLQMAADCRKVEARGVIDAQRIVMRNQRRELRRHQRHEDDLTLELQRFKEENARLAAALDSAHSENETLSAEVQGLKSTKKSLEEEILQWRDFAAMNAANGFETFRSIGREKDSAYPWDEIHFDHDVYSNVTNARLDMEEAKEQQGEREG